MSAQNKSGTQAIPFDKVLEAELDEIAKARKLRNRREPVAPAETDARRRAASSDLTGLAFSGGGIRSATLNLGVLQGLARFKLLGRVDYLSTVSGGGYIGSWFTTWVKRQGLPEVERQLGSAASSPGPEPDAVTHLRRFSNYLTPKLGIFNADALTAVAIYIRNLLLNFTILLPALLAVLAGPRIGKWLTGVVWPNEHNPGEYWCGLVVLAAALYALAVGFGVANLARRSWSRGTDPNSNQEPSWFTRQSGIQIAVVIPAMIGAWAAAPLVLGGIDSRMASVLSSIGIRRLPQWTLSDRAVWGMPVTLSLFALFVMLWVGWLGPWLGNERKEWFSRLGAWLMLYAIGWTAFCAISIYSREYWLHAEPFFSAGGGAGLAKAFQSREMWIGIITTLLGGGAAGVTAGGMDAGKIDGSGKGARLYQIAPYALILGLFLGLSIVLDPLIDFAAEKAPLAGPGKIHGIIAVFLIMSAVALLQSRLIQINEFSLHNFYRNRLVRAYLGASDSHRNPHPFTGFDPKENRVRLNDLAADVPDPADERIEEADLGKTYYGPYPIVNTALNLVAGNNLAWQQRMAASFILTPKFYGFDVAATTGGKRKENLAQHGYRPTANHDGGLSLGTAVATSGAAASPNMGYHSSKPLAFLMTMLNVRLGRWIGNPRHESTWWRSGPTLSLFSLLSELFGMTDDESRYVYLSDGGHFENLGIYELVKRRCRFIIACDGSQDGDFTFEDLGNAIEKCRTDLGVDIRICVDQLRAARGRNSEWHCAIGRIHYGGGAPAGALLYLKASLTGDEPTDVLKYAALNKDFPHQTTGDQWFDESQFESYRALGFHIVNEVIGAVFDRHKVPDLPMEAFVTGLRQHWYPESSAGAEVFTRHSAALQRIWETLRTSRDLKFLDPQVYPEWQELLKGKVTFPKNVFWLPPSENEIRAGFYLCSSIIQLMENVYVDLRLEENWDHPDNRGWMNFFRHWSWAGMFRVTWAITASTYGARFQNFCNRRLELDLGYICAGKPRYLPERVEDQKSELAKLVSELVLNFYEKTIIEKIIAIDGPGTGRCLHPLEIHVSVPELDDRISFPFGFAWVSGGKLRFFRIQDHLRSMGLGRRALESFLQKNKSCTPNLENLPAEAPFPNDKARTEFLNLYRSVCAQIKETASQEIQAGSLVTQRAVDTPPETGDQTNTAHPAPPQPAGGADPE